MKNTLLLLLFVSTIQLTSCNKNKPKTFCDCLGEEADSMKEAAKNNYKDFEMWTFEAVSDECKKILEPYTKDHGLEGHWAFVAAQKECKNSNEGKENFDKFQEELSKAMHKVK